MLDLVCFALDDTRYAVPSNRCIEVVARVLLTPLPEVAPPVLGLFSYRGVPMVAVDLRTRLGHPPRPPMRDDHFLLVRGARRNVALVVDRVTSSQILPQEEMQASLLPSRHVAGLAARPPPSRTAARDGTRGTIQASATRQSAAPTPTGMRSPMCSEMAPIASAPSAGA